MPALAEPPPIASIVIAWGMFGGRGLGWYVTRTLRAAPRQRKTWGPFDSIWEAGQIAASITVDHPSIHPSKESTR